MTAVPVTGSGPVGFTSSKGAYAPIPLNALSLDQGQVKIDTGLWQGDASDQPVAEAWATYLFNQGELAADNSGSKPAPRPAFLVEASHPGKFGNFTTLGITKVDAKSPANQSLIDLAVNVTNDYGTLSLASISSVLGTTPTNGSRPGLVFVDPASTLDDLPKNQKLSLLGLSADFRDAADAKTVFTLKASAASGADTFDAEVSSVDTVANTFQLVVTWTKAEAGKQLATLATDFQYIVKITPPSLPDRYGVPKIGAVPLSLGDDAETVAPVPATGAAPSA